MADELRQTESSRADRSVMADELKANEFGAPRFKPLNIPNTRNRNSEIPLACLPARRRFSPDDECRRKTLTNQLVSTRIISGDGRSGVPGPPRRTHQL